MKEEIWKDIKGYEKLYQVSNLGRIKSLDKIVLTKNQYGVISKRKIKGKIIKFENIKGYNYVGLIKKQY